MIKIFILRDNFRCMQVEEFLKVVTDITCQADIKWQYRKNACIPIPFLGKECEASKIEIFYQN
jgi:hypothetical protein